MVLSKLDSVMKERGLTPEVMCTPLVSSGTIRNARKGRGISLHKATEIAKLLKVKLDELV